MTQNRVPFFTCYVVTPDTRGDSANRVGLLAPGSSYSPSLPILTDSGVLRLSYPVTAAGPQRIFTVFPNSTLYD